MKSIAACMIMMCIVFACSPVFVYAANEGEFSYVGATKCKMCHKSAKAGKQFIVWSESKHAKAYEVLASEEAKKVAKAKGVEDPQKSDACLKCHAPSHNVKAELKGKKYNVAEGVSCEDCHGPGSAYMKMATMKAIAAGKEKGDAYGLVKPDEKTCIKCHNAENPTFDKSKPFVFAEMNKKIAHLKSKAE